MSYSLEESDVRAIIRILGEVAAMESSPESQRTFIMKELAALIGADTWIWAVAPLLEPDKQPVYVYQQTYGLDEARMSQFLQAVEHPDTGAMTTPLARALNEAGGQVTRYLEQIVSRERFEQSPAFPVWKAANVGTLILSIRPLPGWGISCIGFYRAVEAPGFTERESRIAHIVLSEVPILHEAGMPHFEARTTPQLSPRCRLIMNQLVHGMARKNIADHLGLSVNTVHGYTKEIFRHFNVHSQSELIARFTHGDGRHRNAEV